MALPVKHKQRSLRSEWAALRCPEPPAPDAPGQGDCERGQILEEVRQVDHSF